MLRALRPNPQTMGDHQIMEVPTVQYIPATKAPANGMKPVNSITILHYPLNPTKHQVHTNNNKTACVGLF